MVASSSSSAAPPLGQPGEESSPAAAPQGSSSGDSPSSSSTLALRRGSRKNSKQSSFVGAVMLPRDPEEAAKVYLSLRQCVRETFQGFLRNIQHTLLTLLEGKFEEHGGELNSSTFLDIFSKVFPQPESPEFPGIEEKKFIVNYACLLLFEGMDVDQSGEASWMEFVEFVSAVAEELRLQAQELSGQTFDFNGPDIFPFRPQATKSHFDKIFYWPKHSLDSVLVFEEKQRSFHLHRPGTLARRRRVEGHSSDLLAAEFLPPPFEWVVTAANDKTICFWDTTFHLVLKFSMDTVFGTLCWCPEIKMLYAAEHFSPRVRAWKLSDPLAVRSLEGNLKSDKEWEEKGLSMVHKMTVQAMCWMSPLQSLATASLDTAKPNEPSQIQLFDLVQMKRTHELRGHKKAVTCLAYCPKIQMLLSSGFDNFIAIWDPTAGTLSHKLSEHECSIAGLCALPDTDFEFMSVDCDAVVKLWDVRRLVCTQTFHATDSRAEKAGELEALEPRAICPLSRDRVLVAGRRMVSFSRDASEPCVTADFPINAIDFNHRKIEIVTPVKNDIYVWCALRGKLLTIHDNVTENNITAITHGLGERRLFIGADDGEIVVINYDCGAKLSTLEPHLYEVTQIKCIPGKVLTLSTAERIIKIHDDNDPKRQLVLKRIDVSEAGAITQLSFNGIDTIAAASEEGDVVWYNIDLAKEKGSSSQCEVCHQQAVSCCRYFEAEIAPLIVTADAESCLIFWSVPPLRPFNFFSKVELSLGTGEQEAENSAPFGISAMCLSWPEQDHVFVGTERGALACVCISEVVQRARQQRDEIMQIKASGKSADVISGRIFEDNHYRERMPKPIDSPEYVFKLSNVWLQSKAHAGHIQDIVLSERRLSVIFTCGVDVCVRMWSTDGEALGTLEQGLPEGLSYKKASTWRFPIDAHEQVFLDMEAVSRAAGFTPDPEEPVLAAASVATPEAEEEQVREPPASVLARRRSSQRIAAADAAAQMRRSSRRNSLKKSSQSASAPNLQKAGVSPSSRKVLSQKGLQARLNPHQHVTSRIHAGSARLAPTDDWLIGTMSPSYFDNGQMLPRLHSGLKRPPMQHNSKIIEAAKKLSSALHVSRSGVDL